MWAIAALAVALPLHFEPGPSGTEYVANGLRLNQNGIAMGKLRMELPRRKPEGEGLLPGHSNYYAGAERRLDVPQYARVRYRAVFRGVDLEVYGKDGRIEYDWAVAPGADPGAIRFAIRGASGMRVDANGDLVLESAAGEVRHRRPYAYQPGGGAVASAFVLGPHGAVRFRVGAYDRSKPLIIDPTLVYSAGFGGPGAGVGSGIGVDGAGNAYVTGTIASSIFVAKVSADGSSLLYLTYLTMQANSSTPLPASVAVDPNGNAYVTGATNGTTFPSAAGGTLATAGGSDAFVAKLDQNGKLIGSLLLGGSADDAGTSIVFGPDGRVYVAGTTRSSDFALSPGAFRTNPTGQDIFVAKINPAFLFGAVLYTSLLGPGTAPAVAVDSAGNAFVAASTTSASWTPSISAAQPTCAGSPCADVVVAKVNSGGTVLLNTSYLGGSGVETAGGVAVDGSGNVYVSGTTTSADFPAAAGAFQTHWSPPQTGSHSAFVAKFSPELSKLLYSTYLHGDVDEQGQALALDASGNAYVAGRTTSPGFPVVNGFQTSLYNSVCTGTPCASAGFVSVVNASGSGLMWSSYAGGDTTYALALDAAGNLYATGAGTDSTGTKLNGSAGAAVGLIKVAPGGTPLQISVNSVTNGASFIPGLPRPGGLASLFVHGLSVSGTVTRLGYPLPTELVKLSVTVGGVAAPLLSVTNLPVDTTNPVGTQQVNFQVPFEAQSNAMVVRYDGVPTIVIPPPVAPGIFLMPDGSGAIQHTSDYSLVTAANPAKAGEAIVVYVTGLGPVTPPAPTGSPAAEAGTMSGCLLTTTFGPAVYAGVTPGFVGLYQLNLTVPATAAPGSADLQVTFTCGESSSLPRNYVASNTVKVPIQ